MGNGKRGEIVLVLSQSLYTYAYVYVMQWLKMETEKKYKAFVTRGEIVIYRNGERLRSFVTPTYKTEYDASIHFLVELRKGAFEWAGLTGDNTEVEIKNELEISWGARARDQSVYGER